MKNSNISDSSYLGMIIKGLDINPEELFSKDYEDCISTLENIEIQKEQKVLENKEIVLKELKFEEFAKTISATNSSTNEDNLATKLGTITHKIFEQYWDRLEDIDMSNFLASIPTSSFDRVCSSISLLFVFDSNESLTKLLIFSCILYNIEYKQIREVGCLL